MTAKSPSGLYFARVRLIHHSSLFSIVNIIPSALHSFHKSRCQRTATVHRPARTGAACTRARTVFSSATWASRLGRWRWRGNRASSNHGAAPLFRDVPAGGLIAACNVVTLVTRKGSFAVSLLRCLSGTQAWCGAPALAEYVEVIMHSQCRTCLEDSQEWNQACRCSPGKCGLQPRCGPVAQRLVYARASRMSQLHTTHAVDAQCECRSWAARVCQPKTLCRRRNASSWLVVLTPCLVFCLLPAIKATQQSEQPYF